MIYFNIKRANITSTCAFALPVIHAIGIVSLVLLSLTIVGQTLTPTTYITPADRDRFRRIFLSSASDDLESIYYSVVGVANLDETPTEPQKLCERVKKGVKSDDVDSLFYASSIVNVLKAKSSCEVSWGSAETVLKATLTGDSNSMKLWHAVGALKNLGHNVDGAQLVPLLEAALKADDAPLSHAYAFQAAVLATGSVAKIQELIEDVLAQADEIDDKFLQFESGLYTTALVFDSAYKLAAATKAAAPVTDEKVIKFANYFLSRKHTQALKEVSALMVVLNTLANNKFHTPIAVTLASPISVSTTSPTVQVRVSSLVGKSLGALTVTADTARHLGDDAVVLSKKPFTVSSSDPSLYELDLMKVKPESGFYRIVISFASQQPADVKLIGTTGAEVEVKVTARVTVDGVEVIVADREHASAQKTIKLEMPNKAQLEADYHQRITTRFTLKDAVSAKIISAHQTFMRLTNQKTKQEVIFVAEDDGAGVYRFDLDIGAKSKDFNYLSGKYTMELIVGDAVIENPITWNMADVQLTFSEESVSSTPDQYRYAKKPEIKHMFREPEKRPPAAVSNLFTGLVLLPLLILVILWIKIGANVSNFSFSLSTIGFHLGMTGIFALYGCYFLSLNMFTTLRYLAIIGLPTFLFGNKLLSGIAAKRK
jgi:oligosaccharyltransferase complex subunit delta (ribophorin II)